MDSELSGYISKDPGTVEVHVESRADVSSRGFWNQGTTAMFDIQIFNLDVGSYLRMMP